MTEKQITTLIPDIMDMMKGAHKCTPKNVEDLLSAVRDCVAAYIEKEQTRPEGFQLRISKLGTPDRKLWFEAQTTKPEELGYSSVMRFFLGSLIEAIMVFLAKEAGHSVELEQKEIDIDGVPGHIDFIIDGCVVDAKSASGYSYKKKFKEGGLLDGDDPYGYITQLSSYHRKEGGAGKPAYFWAFSKEDGDMTLLELPVDRMVDPEARIKRVKEVLTLSSPPEEKCFPDEPQGSSGNRKLSFNCSYCPFKFKCWENLRVFRYSNKDEYLTYVASEPRVQEVTSEYLDKEG